MWRKNLFVSLLLLGHWGISFSQQNSATSTQQELANIKGIIIKYKSNTTENGLLLKAQAGAALDQVGLQRAQTVAKRFGVSLNADKKLATNGHLLKLSKALTKTQAQLLSKQLAQDSNVEYAEPDYILSAQMTPNDPLYMYQGHYFNSVWGINLPDAWNIASGNGVKVAVVDTGITSHPDLDANVLPGYDFIADPSNSADGGGRDADPSDPGTWGACRSTSSWHGTHVAGTIAAVTNNALGVAGVAYGAKIIPVRVLGPCGGSLSDIAEAVQWAAGGSITGVPNNPNPAKVINMSLGGEAATCPISFQNAITFAKNRGATVVVSAGNSGTSTALATPANCADVVVVAATEENGGRTYFSNYGPHVDVSAPGVAVLSTSNTGLYGPSLPNYASMSGTSMAAPHIAGVAALLLSRIPTLNPAQVEARIKAATHVFPVACATKECGTGIVDAYKAVATVDPSYIIHRYRNMTNLSLFYTMYDSERDYIMLNQTQTYQYEGAGFKTKPIQSTGTFPVYRFQNTKNNTYFYTIYEAEKNNVLANYPEYHYEGIAWYARQTAGSGTVPLYRFRKNSGTPGYLYTAFESEKADILANHPEYTFENIAYYVWPLYY